MRWGVRNFIFYGGWLVGNCASPPCLMGVTFSCTESCCCLHRVCPLPTGEVSVGWGGSSGG